LVVTLIEKVKAEVPEIHVEEIDVAANPALAVKYRVMSTPAVAINGKLEFTGVPRQETLLARLRAAARLSKGTSA
jgi:protein-disulfide isomerase